MGKKKALVVVAHKMLIACFYVLKYKVAYKELGADYFTKGKVDKMVQHYQKQLCKLGYQVALQPITA
jgi:transposase